VFFFYFNEKIPELRSDSVKIKDPNHVNLILSNLIQSGCKRLQVVSDFDRTISLCTYDGQHCPTSNCKKLYYFFKFTVK
jgi:hypothetical protein